MGPRIRRWGIFNVVGLGGFFIQLAAIAVLTRYFEWSPAAATVLGVEIAFLHNFFGHTRWTWREFPLRTPREWLNRWWRYQLAKTGSLAANVAVTMGLVAIVGLPVEAANIAAVVACAIPNFFITEWFVIRNRCVSPP